MPNIEDLVLQDTCTDDELKYLESLKRLSLTRTGCTKLPSNVVLQRITHLDISCGKIRDFSSLLSLTSLTDLDLSDANGSSLEFLTNLTNLTKLNISAYHLLLKKSNITDKEFSYIGHLSCLKYLIMQGLTSVTTLKPLQKLVHLRILDISNCTNLKNPKLPARQS